MIDQVDRLSPSYGYNSHFQPITAWLAFAACLVILLLFNGAVLWKEFYFLHFLSSYLAVSELNRLFASCISPADVFGYQVIIFLALWVLLKVVRTGASWKLEKLTAQRAAKIIRSLNEMRAVTMIETEPETHPL